MATTTYGTPYVQSSDLVSAYPGTSSTLATRVDDISLKGNGINAQTASYTLVLTDGGKNITMTVASANTLTVPTNASVAFPTGVGIGVINLGAGACTVTPAGGVTVNGTSLVLAQYESGVLLKTDTNTWLFSKGGGLPKASYSATTGSPTVDTSSRPGKTILKFTGSGSVTLSSAGVCEILVIGGAGGGGGAGTSRGGGGGGAGGYLYQNVYLSTVGSALTVTVGAGGAGGVFGAGVTGSNGSGSCLHVYAAAQGGGGGGDAGRGGGQGGSTGGGGDTGGSAGTFCIPGQGNLGANGVSGSQGGGGGGSGSAASGVTPGTGTANSITGSSVTYAAGASPNASTPAAGGTNTGNGGQGATGSKNGAAGGSGIVVVVFG